MCPRGREGSKGKRWLWGRGLLGKHAVSLGELEILDTSKKENELSEAGLGKYSQRDVFQVPLLLRWD